MRIKMAQLNPTVGDIEGNKEKIIEVLSQENDVPDLVVFPELFLSGYPPRDLLEKPWFIKRVQAVIEELRKISERHGKTGILLGAPLQREDGGIRDLYNSALLLYQGKIQAVQHKSLLPTYDVFDEARYFEPAREVRPIPFKDEVLGISICEDAWNDPELWPRGRMYTFDPIAVLAQKGATLFLNLSASPFSLGKEEIRYRLLRNHVRRHCLPFVYLNQVGGNDELIFDGRSMVLDKNGELVSLFTPFQEEVRTIDTTHPVATEPYIPQDKIESVYEALVLGIRDYLRKCGFSQVLVGLSGGIDSALTCSLAAEALGKEKVMGISLPGPYSSPGSVEDSRKLAHNLAIEFRVIPITSIYHSYLDCLQTHFADSTPDITEENLQARIRGNILMALSNKFGYLLLSTGNKSELAVGYCTLYGDMSGGLSVISDVPKTMVYELARYVNREREIIPREIMEKAPSAELRPDQKDEDSLPPYPLLDPVLHYYIDENYSLEEIVQLGYPEEMVRKVAHMVDSNEYKRRQAAPGLKVTNKAFGMGRRMPIAARYEK
ncbi:MAG: hypothetical protein PWP04_1748 [Candidatus Atribacteria bacterium]|nr:hypothetical protein [Candidatus Atribacteria bacterium]